jgi:O-antigen ligase
MKDILVQVLTFLIPYQVYFRIVSDKHLSLSFIVLSILVFLCIKNLKILLDDFLAKIYLLFLFVIVLRAIFSTDKIEGLKYILFLSSGLFYYFVYRCSKIKKEKIIVILTIAVLPMVFLMLYTYHNEKYELQILKSHFMKIFINPNTLESVLAGKYYPNIYEENRVGGFFVNANTCSLFLGLIFILVLGLINLVKNFYKKILFFVIAICFLLAIIYTGSVGALVAMCFSLGFGGAIFLIKKFRFTSKKILYSCLFLFILFLTANFLFKINPRVLKMKNNQDFHGRSLIWKASWEVIKNNWFLGTGLSGEDWDRQYNIEAKKINAPENLPPHNMFLYIWGRSGIFAVVLFLVFFLTKFYHSLRNYYVSNNFYSLIVFVSTFWFFIQGMVENFPLMDLRVSAVFWLILGLEKTNYDIY